MAFHSILHGVRRRLGAAWAGMAGDRGNVAIIFALSLPAVAMLGLGAVDIHRITAARSQFQDALDAAALAAARSPYSDPADLKQVALATLRANLQDTDVAPVRDEDVDVSMNDKSVIIADARGSIQTLVANIILPPYGKLLDDTLPVSVHSEVNRSSRDVEVALALDITGSMAGSRITSLKSAAKELIEIVVQPNQSPYYSKVALAPYSAGVNVGSTYAAAVMGPLSSTTRSITDVSWLTGPVRTITGVSRASPAVVTSANHGFANNDRVVIWSAETMSALNGVAMTVTGATQNSFSLSGIDSRNYSAFSGEAYVAKCVRSDCSIIITAAQHGLSTLGDAAVLNNVGGLTQLNGIGFRVAAVSGSTATLALSASRENLRTASKGGAAYTSGGSLACGLDGCQSRDFVNTSGTWSRRAGTTCASERAGAQAYTDAAPTGAASWVGRNYAASGNCPTAVITPLTNVKKTLTDQIDRLATGGTTAGHIGLAWAWYLVSPNFGVWSGSEAPAAYDSAKTLKAVVLMTDGEFNTQYFRGVMSSESGAGGATDRINQGSTNGSAFNQAYSLCQNMKAAGVIVYTVGFSVGQAGNLTGSIDSAGELMARCATDPSRAFMASSSTDLHTAFRDIGRDITRLRISR